MKKLIERLQDRRNVRRTCLGGMITSSRPILGPDGTEFFPLLSISIDADAGQPCVVMVIDPTEDQCRALLETFYRFAEGHCENGTCPDRLEVVGPADFPYLRDRLQDAGIAVHISDDLPKLVAVADQIVTMPQAYSWMLAARWRPEKEKRRREPRRGKRATEKGRPR